MEGQTDNQVATERAFLDFADMLNYRLILSATRGIVLDFGDNRTFVDF